MKYKLYLYPYIQTEGCSILVVERPLTYKELNYLIWDTEYVAEDLSKLVLSFDSKEAALAAGFKPDDLNELLDNEEIKEWDYK